MKKAPVAVALVLVFGLFAAAFSLAPAVAQNATTTTTGNETSTTGTTTNATSGTGTNATGSNQTSTAAEGSTFSASGRIAAIIFDVPDANETETTSDTGSDMSSTSNATSSNATSGGSMSGDNTTMSQTVTGGNETSMTGNDTSSSNATSTSNATGTTGDTMGGMNDTSTAAEEETELPYIVSGDWSLDVQDGSVSDFAANFTMVHTDGTSRHTHDVSNFQASNGSAVQLEEDGVTFIFGTSDIATNGSSGWTGVDTLIVIENSNAVSLTFSTEDDHFKGQPLFGVVDSLTDEQGNEMIQTTESAQEGNSTGVSETVGDAANATGDFLGDVGESIQNMTGLG